MQKKISHLQVSKYDEGFPPENFEQFVLWVQSLVDDIPVEYRPGATIEFQAVNEYGSPGIDLDVSYLRPETEAETVQRLADEALQRQRQEQRERATYAQLAAKYGDKPA